jgi:hypothetical protein
MNLGRMTREYYSIFEPCSPKEAMSQSRFARKKAFAFEKLKSLN